MLFRYFSQKNSFFIVSLQTHGLIFLFLLLLFLEPKYFFCRVNLLSIVFFFEKSKALCIANVEELNIFIYLVVHFLPYF